MAGEDRFGVDGGVFHLLLRGADEFVEPEETLGHGSGVGLDAERGLRGRFDTDKRHALEVGSVIAGGFDAGECELRGQVFDGEIAATRADATPFQQIAGEEFHVCA